MMKRIAGILAATVLLALTADCALAIDVVLRRSTTTKGQGEVTAITKTEVTVKPKTGDAVEIPANDVVQIDWTEESAVFKLARSDANGGRLQKALDSFNKILAEGKVDREFFKTDLEFFIARATAKIALADPTKLDDAIKKIEQFKDKHAESYRFYENAELLGELYLAKKDLDRKSTRLNSSHSS